MVNLILTYMAKLDVAAVGLIKDIISDLISAEAFEKYLLSSPI